MNKIKLACDECITFPICHILAGRNSIFGDRTKNVRIRTLRNRCSIFDKLCKDNSHIGSDLTFKVQNELTKAFKVDGLTLTLTLKLTDLCNKEKNV